MSKKKEEEKNWLFYIAFIFWYSIKHIRRFKKTFLIGKMLRVPIYLNHMMQGCSTSRRLKFFVNLIQSSFGAMLMIYFFVHTSLVNSLLFYFCACYFEVLLSKWLLCIFFFCITNQIFCAYIQLYQLPTRTPGIVRRKWWK